MVIYLIHTSIWVLIFCLNIAPLMKEMSAESLSIISPINYMYTTATITLKNRKYLV